MIDNGDDDDGNDDYDDNDDWIIFAASIKANIFVHFLKELSKLSALCEL